LKGFDDNVCESLKMIW